jgi:DNA-binding ferritin-like protein
LAEVVNSNIEVNEWIQQATQSLKKYNNLADIIKCKKFDSHHIGASLNRLLEQYSQVLETTNEELKKCSKAKEVLQR